MLIISIHSVQHIGDKAILVNITAIEVYMVLHLLFGIEHQACRGIIIDSLAYDSLSVAYNVLVERTDYPA
jgi:hypothetical protein